MNDATQLLTGNALGQFDDYDDAQLMGLKARAEADRIAINIGEAMLFGISTEWLYHDAANKTLRLLESTINVIGEILPEDLDLGL
jgi:hypothetical protein